MHLQFSLQPSLSQQLTPQVIQHLAMLQLPVIELQQMLQEKMMENPLLDLTESSLEKPYDWLRTASVKSMKGSANNEPYLISKTSTREFLVEQIPLFLSAQERTILHYCIESLDERLFITETPAQIADHFGIHIDKVTQTLSYLRKFEPIGVGAIDFIDFLMMQIEHDQDAPSLAKEFVQFDMPTIAKMDVARLCKKYQIVVQEALQVIDYIKQLPRTPAVSLHELAPFIVPDATIKKIDYTVLIELNDRTMPSIKLQDVYVELLKQEDQPYLQKCLREYTTLVTGIDFRKKTLYAVLDYIVSIQSAYFEKGCKNFKPMGLKDVAEHLNLSESTISRAIKGKYIETDYGIIAIQDLFVKSVGNSTPDSICQVIAAIIAAEPKKKPYSDQQLVHLLQAQNIDISRRTVTKYREQLGIPNSQKRLFLT